MSKVVEIIENNAGNDGLSRISQKEIANQIGKSPSCISKMIRKLEKYDECIEKIAPSIYKVNQKDILNYGPISKLRKYSEIILRHPEIFIKSLEEQSILTNMSIEDIRMIYGYLHGAFGGTVSVT